MSKRDIFFLCADLSDMKNDIINSNLVDMENRLLGLINDGYTVVFEGLNNSMYLIRLEREHEQA